MIVANDCLLLAFEVFPHQVIAPKGSCSNWLIVLWASVHTSLQYIVIDGCPDLRPSEGQSMLSRPHPLSSPTALQFLNDSQAVVLLVDLSLVLGIRIRNAWLVRLWPGRRLYTWCSRLRFYHWQRALLNYWTRFITKLSEDSLFKSLYILGMTSI